MARNEVVGLYDERHEHDSCGVAFVADMARGPSHEIVDLALTSLEHLAHRGAFGADPETGDGAGILLQLPHRLFAEVVAFELPEPGHYATGIGFLPSDGGAAEEAKEAIESVV